LLIGLTPRGGAPSRCDRRPDNEIFNILIEFNKNGFRATETKTVCSLEALTQAGPYSESAIAVEPPSIGRVEIHIVSEMADVGTREDGLEM
jgi:hypothetical protein